MYSSNHTGNLSGICDLLALTGFAHKHIPDPCGQNVALIHFDQIMLKSVLEVPYEIQN